MAVHSIPFTLEQQRSTLSGDAHNVRHQKKWYISIFSPFDTSEDDDLGNQLNRTLGCNTNAPLVLFFVLCRFN